MELALSGDDKTGNGRLHQWLLRDPDLRGVGLTLGPSAYPASSEQESSADAMGPFEVVSAVIGDAAAIAAIVGAAAGFLRTHKARSGAAQRVEFRNGTTTVTLTGCSDDEIAEFTKALMSGDGAPDPGPGGRSDGETGLSGE